MFLMYPPSAPLIASINSVRSSSISTVRSKAALATEWKSLKRASGTCTGIESLAGPVTVGVSGRDRQARWSNAVAMVCCPDPATAVEVRPAEYSVNDSQTSPRIPHSYLAKSSPTSRMSGSLLIRARALS
jgi:hypothetical protein